MSSVFESALIADGAFALLVPDPATGTVVDRCGNYTTTLQNGATVTSDTLVAGVPGAISLDGSYASVAAPTRRNLCTNPSFETNTTGWATVGGALIGGAALTRVTTQQQFGVGSGEVLTAATKNQGIETTAAVNAGNHTAAAYVRAPLGAAMDVGLGDGAVGFTIVPFTGTGAWQRVSVTRNFAAPGTARVSIRQASATAQTFHVDAVLLETGSSVNTFFDGSGYVNASGTWVPSAGIECGWLGTAHASASDRGPLANGTTRTFEGVAQASADAGASVAQTLLGSDLSTNGTRLDLYNSAGTRQARLQIGGTTYTWTLTADEIAATAAGQIFVYRLEFNETANTATLQINGLPAVQKTSVTAQHAAGQTAVQLGAYASGSSPLPGKLGTVAIFYRALTAAAYADHYALATVGPPRVSILREPAPAHQLTAVSSNGQRTRWADDERNAENVPSGLTWSTSMPGGSDTLRCTLPRDPERSYGDLGLLTELRVSRDGGRTLRYRLDEAPKVSGDQMAVEPAARGYRAALEDRADVRALFVDRDMSRWEPMSRARRITSLSGGLGASDPTLATDGSGLPAVILEHVGNWDSTAYPNAEAIYKPGVPITGILGSLQWQLASATAGFSAFVGVADDDIHTNREQTSDLTTGTASGTATISFSPTTPRKVGILRWLWDAAGGDQTGIDNTHYTAAFRTLAAVGTYLTAVTDANGLAGFYTGPMLEYLIDNETSLSTGTIDDGTFIHTHAAYLDPTTALSIAENLSRYEPLYDWFVYDNFEFRRRGTYGKRWRARVGPSGLRSAGQTTERLWNEIAVKVQDPLYGEQIVGPTDSGYANTSDYLRDTDPDNPANQAGIIRRELLDIGEGTIEGAIEVGRRFLEESKRLDNSGQCELTGYVEDEAGAYFPVDAVVAGDEISFSDSGDTSWRRISTTSYSHDSQTNALSIDAPAATIQGLLARLQAVLVPLG